jgi:hypothetical protein
LANRIGTHRRSERELAEKPLYKKNIAEDLSPLVDQLVTEGNLAEAERLYARATAVYRELTPLFSRYSSLPRL